MVPKGDETKEARITRNETSQKYKYTCVFYAKLLLQEITKPFFYFEVFSLYLYLDLWFIPVPRSLVYTCTLVFSLYLYLGL